MVKIIVTAPKGHMDSLIVKEAMKRDDIQVVGGLGPSGREYIGQDIGVASGAGREAGALVYDNLEEIIDRCDLVVDFSTVELSMEVLEVCLKHRKALICGTTGFDPQQEDKLLAAGKTIPMMKAANTSYVVNVMQKLLGQAAAALGDRCKVEIIDYHSQTKIDAPSGTAKELAAEIVDHSEKDIEDITFHSIRAGNTPSSHKVIFGCMGELMEISHHAYSRECCAAGACDAMIYVMGHGVGLHTMEDVVGL